MTAVITLATFLAMFMDDCRLAFLPPPNDVSCQIVSVGILVWLPAAQHHLSIISTHVQIVASAQTRAAAIYMHIFKADVYAAGTSGYVLHQGWACFTCDGSA